MSTRTLFALSAPVALCALLLALLPATAGAKTVTAELRVLTGDRVVDPGTDYVVGAESVRTDPNADCNFGGTGGSGASFDFPRPTAVSLLAAAAAANPAVRPLSVSDEFGFGLALCAVGGVDDQEGTFWYLKRNHTELAVGVDQEPIANGDQLLVYLAPDNFPAPNPSELELRAPARVKPGQPFAVTVTAHGCVTDPNPPFATSCEDVPAAGATLSGAGGTVTTAADGTAQVVGSQSGRLALTAFRGTDIPSERLKVCVDSDLSACPARRGERIIGRDIGDRIKGTDGPDTIRARGGRDRVLVRGGGADKVDCGPGRDRVLADRHDDPAKNCERVRR